jgi:hypothetical protein
LARVHEELGVMIPLCGSTADYSGEDSEVDMVMEVRRRLCEAEDQAGRLSTY